MGWQKDEILDEARRQGIDTGDSSSQLDHLQKLAEELGMDHYNGTSNDDTDELERRLKERKAQEEAAAAAEAEEGEDVEGEPELDENGEPISEADKAGLKKGFGRDEYAKTIGNSNYYKEQGELLRKRQEEAEREKNNRFKNRNKDGEGSKELSKSERDEQSKSSKPAEGEEKKNIKDKIQDRKNVYEARKATAQNKINSLKAKAYKARHPVEAAKAEAKNKIKKKLRQFLIKYWWVVAIAVAVLGILAMIILIILAVSSDGTTQNGHSYSYLDEKYDYTTTLVTVTTSEGIPFETRISLDELVMGAVYYATLDKTEELTNENKLELYGAYSVIFRTEALVLGGYDNENKEITIKSGSDFPYCDVYNGCLKIKNGDKISYVSAAMSEEIKSQIQGEVVAEYPPLDEVNLSLLESATEDTTWRLLTPKSFDEALTEADFDNPEFNPEIEEKIYQQVIEKDTSYITILRNVYSDSEVYNINDYATEYYIIDSTAYWVPIGSSNPTSGNIYGGKPSIAVITSEFGWRTIQGHRSNHKGIDLAGTAGTTVVIATRSGTVTTANDGCPNNSGSTYQTEAGKCGGGYGNHIVIDHGDGTSSLYAHLTPGSLTVKTGTHVNQGQKIALVGSSGNVTGPHLHFEIRENGTQVDPMKYISLDNPRPQGALTFTSFVQGESPKQSVCLTLKASGLTDNATAAILSNINSESSFRTSGTNGDGGTSDGLCQWHNGRLTRLKSSEHCGPRWAEVGCQIEYLFWELKNEETSTYNELLSDHSAYDIAAFFCVHFERPANKDACYSVRGVNARDTYLPYVKNGCKD